MYFKHVCENHVRALMANVNLVDWVKRIFSYIYSLDKKIF